MKKKTTFNERRRGFMPFCLSLCFFMALGSMMSPLGAVEHSKSGNEQHSTQTVKQVLSYIEANSDYVILYSKNLLEALDKLQNNNAQNEYYLTDAPALIQAAGGKVKVYKAVLNEQIIGVNTPEQLAQTEQFLRQQGRA